MRNYKNGLTDYDRLRLKVRACLYAVILIAVLLFFRVLLFFVHMVDEQFREPVIEVYENAWIMDATQQGLTVFWDGQIKGLSYETQMSEPAVGIRENIADITLKDGLVTDILLKQNVISGKVLRSDGTSVEIEGFGTLPLSENYKGYRLFGTIGNCTVNDLYFGYSYADFCLEEGKICGVLMVREEVMSNIRVLIRNSDYSGIFHEEVAVTCDVPFQIQYGHGENVSKMSYQAMEEIAIDGDGENVTIIPSTQTGRILLKNCNRNQGTPAYRGTMEVLPQEQGFVVVNELPLEEYLYSVVPSEMPSGYPEEALKAQAICARTYAYKHMMNAGYPNYGAHVDDSSSYQVYNNISEQDSTTRAAKATYGQILLTAEQSPATTFYYSTSCGMGADPRVWKTKEAETIEYIQARPLNDTYDVRETNGVSLAEGERAQVGGKGAEVAASLGDEDAFRQFITSKTESDFESEEAWYRWTYEIEKLDKANLYTRLQKRQETNAKLVLVWNSKTEEYESKEIRKFNKVLGIQVEKRGNGGYIDELIVETDKQKIKVISEHNVRYVLNGGDEKVILQDGKEMSMPSLLPSGFFVIDTVEKKGEVTGYRLTGGGFGHGVGMSQNGAKNMAQKGYTAEKILLFFYNNCHLKNIYESSADSL